MKARKVFHSEVNNAVSVAVNEVGSITFYGILGYDCGNVVPYVGPDKRMQDKGFQVNNGIPTLRGFAKISDLAKASQAKYKEYQRQKNKDHVEEIVKFLDECKAEAKFLPEVVLSVNSNKTAVLKRYYHKAFSRANETLRGAVENMEYYTLQVHAGSLSRIDGNHRLEAGTDKDYYVPFSIVVWGLDSGNEENLLSTVDDHNNTESEAFLFYILNNKAKRLESEENFKGLVQSKSWTEKELSLIHKQLPVLKHFNEKYANNPLVDENVLPNPLTQVCEILSELDEPNLCVDKFDILFLDAVRLLVNPDAFAYCRQQFPNVLFQLAFYARYNSDDINDANKKLSLIDKWLERYKYTGEIFSRASKLFDVAYKHILASPKTVFMAMEYKRGVKDYNNALNRAAKVLNDLVGGVVIKPYPIMSYKGKSVNITNDIYKKIDDCAIFIADITEANPNVMYELGIAYNQKKPIILVKEKGKRCKVPSDIISDYYYTFSDITELEALFATHMKEILASDYGMVFQK